MHQTLQIQLWALYNSTLLARLTTGYQWSLHLWCAVLSPAQTPRDREATSPLDRLAAPVRKQHPSSSSCEIIESLQPVLYLHDGRPSVLHQVAAQLRIVALQGHERLHEAFDRWSAPRPRLLSTCVTWIHCVAIGNQTRKKMFSEVSLNKVNHLAPAHLVGGVVGSY